MGILIFFFALCIGIICFTVYSYKITFYVPKKRHEDLYRPPNGEQYAPWAQKMLEISMIMADAPCQCVQIQSHDGLTLHARLYEFYPGAPVILAFHGYRSMALRDCAGAFALAQKLGFNILAADQRGHGLSEGRAISFGIRERYDCQRWAKYLSDRFGNDTPIILSGISMGAATVLMAAQLQLPEKTVAIMADCPYSSPAAIIGKVASDLGYPKKLALPVIRLGAMIFGGFDIASCAAETAVRQTDLPVVLIHGDDDRFIPWEMSQSIAANCRSNAQLHLFPGAGHGLCYIMDPKRYEKICVDFLWQIPSVRPWLETNDFANNMHNCP